MHGCIRPYLLMMCAAMAALVCGCSAQLSPQAKELLAAGTDAYAAGDNRLAVERMDAFLAEAGRTREAAEAFYVRGLAKYKLGDRAGARQDMQEALARTEDSLLAAKASLALGDLAFEADEMALAENMYRQALADLEEGVKPTDHAHFRLGNVLQRQGRWREADVEFSRVIYFFNGSELARRSKQRLHARAWTVQAGAYAKHENAVAALERMKRASLAARIEPFMAGRQLQFVIKVGRYPSYEQAVAALSNVKAIQSDAFVTSTE